MRLTEEIVRLLTLLGENEKTGSPTRDTLSRHMEAPDEVIAECRHEGYLESGSNGTIGLTAYGQETLRAIRQRLSTADKLSVGEQARLAFLSTRDYPRFQKLSALGLTPGVPIRMEQRFPSFVILCEETQIALEEDIARDIYIWRD